MMSRLADTSFIERCENVLSQEQQAVAKSFIATALGYQACQLGLKWDTFPYKLCKNSILPKQMVPYARSWHDSKKMNLLILDDWGLQPLDPPCY
jgi:DNA replication protein DnaC